MDLDQIINKVEKDYEKKRVPSFLREAIINSNESDHTFSKTFNRFGKIINGIYKIKPDFYSYLEKTIFNPDLIDYISAAIRRGRSESEIMSEGFSAIQPTYDRLPEKREFGNLLSEILPNIKIVDTFKSLEPTIDEELFKGYQGDQIGSIPADKELGTVSFHAKYTTIDTREKRIQELKRLSERMLGKPRPEVLYIAMTEEQARAVIKAATIAGDIIANDYPVTYDMDKYILAVAWNGGLWKPLATHMVDSDNYPEQLFTDEFEDWMSQLETMWYVKDLPTNFINHFIDLWQDSFWYEGFLRKWNRVGGGGAAIESIKTEITQLPTPTEQDEFFVDKDDNLSYRVDPGSYNSVLNDPINNNFTINQLGPGHLLTEIDYSNNTGCLKYNKIYGGVQSYYRVFRSQVGRPKSNAYIFIAGCFEPVLESHLKSDVFRMDIKLPGVTGWLDCTKNFEERDFNGTDGQGIFLSFGRFGQGILELTFAQFNNDFSERQAILRIIHLDRGAIALSRISFINWRNLYENNTN